MKIILILYLLGGILLNIFGDWAKIIKSDVKALRNSPADDPENENPKKQWIKFIAAEFIIRLLIIVFFPVALILMFINHFRGLKGGKTFIAYS